jgi:hypothetical protein
LFLKIPVRQNAAVVDRIIHNSKPNAANFLRHCRIISRPQPAALAIRATCLLTRLTGFH